MRDFSTSKSMLIIFILLPLFLLPVALAHVPLTSEGNDSLETATVISDPTKSWAIYGEIHDESIAHYYLLDMMEGQLLYASLFIPPKYYQNGFLPTLLLIGPGVTSTASIPPLIEVPSGSNALIIEGPKSVKPAYEPFTPSSLYNIAEIRLNAPSTGSYYLVVYEPDREGHYGLAVGYREEFTLREWILVPIDVIGIHQWEGQSAIFILAPLLVIVILGIAVIILQGRERGNIPRTAFHWAVSLAGLLFLGSGAMMLTQMIIASSYSPSGMGILVTITFTIPSIILGFIALRIGLKEKEKVSVRQRITIAVIGFLSLFVWAGLLVGPILAILASILPIKRSKDLQ